MRRLAMRRIVSFAGIVIIAAVAVALATTSLKGSRAPSEATAGEATMHPFELMQQHGGSLPHEHWRDAF
jgi:hypothetical protein